MALRPASWSSTIMYWSASPRTASTAVSKVGLASIMSAISPMILPDISWLMACPAVFWGFIMALTPSRYHSKLSSIFFKVFKFDLTVLRSSSMVWVNLTCWLRALFFCSNWFAVILIWSVRSFISCLMVSSCSRALPSSPRVRLISFWAWFRPSSTFIRRFCRLSLLLMVVW